MGRVDEDYHGDAEARRGLRTVLQDWMKLPRLVFSFSPLLLRVPVPPWFKRVAAFA